MARTVTVVSTFVPENRLPKVLFSNPLPKKRSSGESQKSGFRFDLKNLPGVWILWIHDPFLDFKKKTQNPFLDSEIRIWIFPKKKNAPSVTRHFYSKKSKLALTNRKSNDKSLLCTAFSTKVDFIRNSVYPRPAKIRHYQAKCVCCWWQMRFGNNLRVEKF